MRLDGLRQDQRYFVDRRSHSRIGGLSPATHGLRHPPMASIDSTNTPRSFCSSLFRAGVRRFSTARVEHISMVHPSLLPLQAGWPDWSPTARIDRAHSDRARSASKKDGPMAPVLSSEATLREHGEHPASSPPLLPFDSPQTPLLLSRT